MGNDQKVGRHNNDFIVSMVISEPFESTQIRTMIEENGAIDRDKSTPLLNGTKTKEGED